MAKTTIGILYDFDKTLCTTDMQEYSFIKNLGMTRTNIFSALIPAVSAVGAAMLGQEEITLMSAIGIAVVTAGVIIAQRQ